MDIWILYVFSNIWNDGQHDILLKLLDAWLMVSMKVEMV